MMEREVWTPDEQPKDETWSVAAVDPSPPEPENIAVEWDEERQQYVRIEPEQ